MNTTQPGLYLGIDGGGTKTETVIANENGIILGRGLAGGANPHNVPLPEVSTQISKSIGEAIKDVQKNHPEIASPHFESGCLGLGGIDTPFDRARVIDHLQHLPHKNSLFPKKLILVNDGLIGLKAGTDKEWGVCLLASTGCNVYGVNRQDEEASAGDWGYLLGDQASGFAIGQKIIRQVIKESDGRLPHSPLSQAVLKFLHMESVEDLIPWAYSDKVPVREIASLAQLVSNQTVNTNPYLVQMVNDAARELLQAYAAVVQRLKLGSEDHLPVVLLGGLFAHEETFTNQVIQGIQSLSLHPEITISKVSAVAGALKIARMAADPSSLPHSATILSLPQS